MKEYKQLFRSRKHKWIGGVCGGIAEYFQLDPLIVRLLTIILMYFGLTVLIYILLWIIVPKAPIEPLWLNEKQNCGDSCPKPDPEPEKEA